MKVTEKYNRVIEAIRTKAKETLPEGSEVRLFGSRARGEARADSDWDLLILIPGSEKTSWTELRAYAHPFYDIELDMEEEMNIIVHTFDGWENLRYLPLRHNIDKEGVLL